MTKPYTRAWTTGQCVFVFLAGVMAIWAVVLWS